MSDETPEEGNNEQELFKSLNADLNLSEAQESWIMFHEVYQGMLSGGFTEKESLTILTSLMWKMMLEGGGGMG